MSISTKPVSYSILFLVGFHLLDAQVCTPRLDSTKSTTSNIVIGALMDLSTSVDVLCETVNEQSVQELEAFRWSLRRIQESGYLENINIDVIAYDTCNNEQVATKALRKLLMTSRQSYVDVDCGNSTQLLLGILGPSSSGPAGSVGRLLNLTGADERLLQISHSATATFLTTSEDFSHFYSLVPTNRQQAMAIMELLKTRGWNYITLVTTDDAYGRDGGEAMTSLAHEYSVCIAVHEILRGNKPDDETKIIRVLDKITISAMAPPKVVVFFGKASFAVRFLMAAAGRGSANNLEFVFSDAIQPDQNEFYTNKKVSLGSLVIVPSYTEVHEFKQHWVRLMTNSSEVKKASLQNPRLSDVFRKLHCDQDQQSQDIDLCDVSKNVENLKVSVFSYYSILAAHVFANIAKNLVDCSDVGCTEKKLREIKRKDILDYLGQEDINLSEIPNIPIDLKNRNGEISFKVGRKPADSLHLFDVFSFQKCENQTYCFVKVGSYNRDGLQLSLDKLKMYDSGLNEIPPKPAVCPQSFVCEACLKTAEQKRWLYIPGDVVIIAAVPLHFAGDEPYTVGRRQDADNFQLSEAFLFALDIVNKKNGIFGGVFPGKKIGLLIFDSAASPSVAQKALHNIFFGGDMYLPNWEEISSKVIGVVGSLYSTITKDLANVIMKMKLPQISYASTSDTLSDRISYPYFARTCAPDSKQTQLMITLLKTFKWNIFSLVYIENEYGRNAANMIIEKAERDNICIAQSISITEKTNPHHIIANLRKTPYAKVVIIITHGSHVGQIFREFTANGGLEIGEFIFLGSEAWGNRPYIVAHNPVTEGAITLIQDFPIITGFNDKLGKKNPDNVHGMARDWLMPVWQKFMDCSWEGSYDQHRMKQCNKSDSATNHVNYFQDPWVPFAVYAFYSMVIGVDKAWKRLPCDREDVTKVCSELRAQPWEVYEEILKTRFDTMGTGSASLIYDKDGNGHGGYKIFNVQKTSDGSALEYKEVGYWTNGELQIDLNKVKFPGKQAGENIVSDIPNDKVREWCKVSMEKTENHDNGYGDGSNVPTNFYGTVQFIAPITTIIVLSIALIVLIILLMVCHRRRKLDEDDGYLSAVECDPNKGGDNYKTRGYTEDSGHGSGGSVSALGSNLYSK